jgi:hypothetical protein
MVTAINNSPIPHRSTQNFTALHCPKYTPQSRADTRSYNAVCSSTRYTLPWYLR